MKILLKPGLMVAAVLVSSAAIAATASLQPGYYENKLTMSQGGSVDVTRDCVKPGETQTVEQLTKELTEDRTCRFTRRTIGGGKIDVAATCVGNDGTRSSYTQVGTYSPTSVTMRISGFAMVGGQKIDLGMNVASRRIAAFCPRAAG